MNFTKMQGLGNDYIYLDCMRQVPEALPDLARRMSSRHFGVGADGLICALPSLLADVRMRMFNADGSEGEMCGNGIRCLGKFVYDKGLVPQTSMTVETPAGIKLLTLQVEAGVVKGARVDMGIPLLSPPREIEIKGARYRIIPVSMGNPHAVLFLEEINDLALEELGPGFERHPSFPSRVNTEFVQILDRSHLRMRVWERGSGETLACGTGACAALAAAAAEGQTGRRATVHLLGGDLSMDWRADGHMEMTGPAVTVFEGSWEHGADQ